MKSKHLNAEQALVCLYSSNWFQKMLLKTGIRYLNKYLLNDHWPVGVFCSYYACNNSLMDQLIFVFFILIHFIWFREHIYYTNTRHTQSHVHFLVQKKKKNRKERLQKMFRKNFDFYLVDLFFFLVESCAK